MGIRMNRKNLGGVGRAVALLAIVAAISTCGGGRKSALQFFNQGIGAQNQRITPFEPQPVKSVSLAELIAELEELAPPEDVSPQVFGEVKAELLRELKSRSIERVVSAPPSGTENEVTDFTFYDNGDGNYTFEWSYVNVGDFDQSGIVDIRDVGPLARHFFHNLENGEWDDDDDEVIDGNFDGRIDIRDVKPLADHFFSEVAGYEIWGAETEDGEFQLLERVPFSEGVEGSRKRFVKILAVGNFRYFYLLPYDRAGAGGVRGPTRGFGPTAQADANQVDGLTFKFYGVGSTPRGGNVSYLWDFNSNGIIDTALSSDPNASAGEQSPTYTFPEEGTYVATLKVFDARGNFSEAKVTVNAFTGTPTNAPPSATALVGDLTGQAPFTVRFIGIGDDPDGSTSSLSYEWNFGDGTPVATSQFVEHTYSASGLYRVRLKVTDDKGMFSFAQLTLAVCYTGPIPDLAPSSLMFVGGDFRALPLTVPLAGLGADMDGGPAPTFTWNFGYNSAGDTARDTAHTFPLDGNYFVTMTSEDDEGNEASSGMTIFVGTPAPSASYPPAVWLAGYMLSGSQNYRQQFRTNAFDPDGGDVTLAWDFDGDGVFGDFGDNTSEPIVTYTVPGNYEVWLEATDDEGEKAYAFISFVVHTCGIPPDIPPPPPNHVVDGGDGGGDGRIGINPKCYPKPLVIFHGQRGTLYLIYNGPVDPGDPRIGNITIQSFGEIFNPLPVGIGNAGNGAGGADIVERDPFAPAPPSPPLKPQQSWSAFTVSRPLDPPSRIEHLSIQFKLKDDGRAAANKTCDVYVIHLQHHIVGPTDGGTVEGPVDITVQVDPAGTDQTFGFPGIDPGELIRVYLTIDGVLVGEMTRTPGSNEWTAQWNSGSVPNGAHTIDYHIYDARGPQPGEPGDLGPIEEGQIVVNVNNPPPPEISTIDLETLEQPPFFCGTPFNFIATTRDAFGIAYTPFFDVFLEVSPPRSDTRSQVPGDTGRGIFQMQSVGDGTYTLPFFSEVAGIWNATVFVRDNRTGDKVGELIDTLPIEMIPLTLQSVNPHFLGAPNGPIMFFGSDVFGNTVPAQPGDFDITSDIPELDALQVQQSPLSNNLFYFNIRAYDYTLGNFTITHIPTGASTTVLAGYPPWKFRPRVRGQFTGNEAGVPFGEDLFFDLDVRIPEGATRGWKSFEAEFRWPQTAPLSYKGTFPGLPDMFVDDLGGPRQEGSEMVLDVYAEYRGLGENFGENLWPIYLQFGTPPPGMSEEPISTTVTLSYFQHYNGDHEIIPYDYGLFATPIGGFSFVILPITVKPTKILNMHVYLVEGAATQEDAEADIQAAEDMFNVNAASCTLGFYVDFVPTFTTIPADDWNNIDEDGDGLDRYDANGDGDYDDPLDNNDLFNAMNAGYYDFSANTENIYYVPGIRGGYLGSTYWPNQQVAVDNGADPDNLTLAHEKVHEMDLRGDGDFDVHDGADMDDANPGVQRDPNAEAQGAYGPGNIMNYADTGRILSAGQAQHLDP